MNVESFQINALIVDPQVATRMRLKQAAISVPRFSKVVQHNTPMEARCFLESSGSEFDVIFISYSLDTKAVTEFISEVKSLKASQDAAFVLVLRSKDQDKSLIAQQMMMGIDGFLFEPYSVDSLMEMTELARRVKDDRVATRQAMAVKLITTEVMQQLDLIADLKSAGYAVSKSKDKFKQLASNFQELLSQQTSQAMEIVMKTFMEARTPPNKLRGKKYGGVSERVKQRMANKLIEEHQVGRKKAKV